MTMPAGTYYIGDLCYVMSPEWDEFCGITIDVTDHTCKEGEFTLADGRRFASYSTMYGDGIYTSNIGTGHPVDAGLIGCIRLDDIRDPNMLNSNGEVLIPSNTGAVVTFNASFETSESNGVIRFGHVTIDTDYSQYDYDEYDDE